MAINSIKTGQSVAILNNQSSITRNTDINNISYRGINIIVSKPQVGDVMCVTRFTDPNDSSSLLGSDKQKVFFVSSSSIRDIYSLTHDNQDRHMLDTVGIVLKVMGNKALVRYKKVSDETYPYCAIKARLQLQDGNGNNGVDKLIQYVKNGARPTVNIVTPTSTLNLKIGEDSSIDYGNYNRAKLVDELNYQLVHKYASAKFSFNLINTDSDALADDISDAKDSNGNYRNRVVLNYNASNVSINYTGAAANSISIAMSNVTANYLPMSKLNQIYFLNNGFTRYSSGGCCRAALYDTGVNEGKEPTSAMTNINNLPGVGDYAGEWVVSPSHFANSRNCQILRDNFANYDEYIDSLMIKVPCNAIIEGNGNAVATYPSGKENTSKLATGSFNVFGQSNKLAPLYPAAYYCYSLDINGPGLTQGNWWLPSGAEMVEIMKDVTYKTSKDGEGDLVEKLCIKYNEQCPSEWSVLVGTENYITSDIKLNSIASVTEYTGVLGTKEIWQGYGYVIPITIYEF